MTFSTHEKQLFSRTLDIDAYEKHVQKNQCETYLPQKPLLGLASHFLQIK